MDQENGNSADTSAGLLALQKSAQFHLRVGWWSMLAFLTLGILLELLHGLKIGWYLDVDNTTRRLMFTLSHAHGTLFALVNIAFGWTVTKIPDWRDSQRVTASRCLFWGSMLVPLGFLFGGIFAYPGDPGLGILLVPAGAVFLLISVSLTAIAMQRCKPRL